MKDKDFIFHVELNAQIKFDEETKVFVSYVPALNIYSQGTTIEQSKIAIKDAVESFLIVSHGLGIRKCKKCYGQGEIIYSYPRPGGIPGYQHMTCDNCNGKGTIKKE